MKQIGSSEASLLLIILALSLVAIGIDKYQMSPAPNKVIRESTIASSCVLDKVTLSLADKTVITRRLLSEFENSCEEDNDVIIKEQLSLFKGTY